MADFLNVWKRILQDYDASEQMGNQFQSCYYDEIALFPSLGDYYDWVDLDPMHAMATARTYEVEDPYRIAYDRAARGFDTVIAGPCFEIYVRGAVMARDLSPRRLLAP